MTSCLRHSVFIMRVTLHSLALLGYTGLTTITPLRDSYSFEIIGQLTEAENDVYLSDNVNTERYQRCSPYHISAIDRHPYV